MLKARAISIQLTPFTAGCYSIKQTALFALERMYGTRERSNGTMLVAFLMLVLGMMLQSLTAGAPVNICTLSTLKV